MARTEALDEQLSEVLYEGVSEWSRACAGGAQSSPARLPACLPIDRHARVSPRLPAWRRAPAAAPALVSFLGAPRQAAAACSWPRRAAPSACLARSTSSLPARLPAPPTCLPATPPPLLQQAFCFEHAIYQPTNVQKL